ncbi:putative quinol monooxygenase [Novosphingobium resinovorum]|uniref:ABM domain-containing protein n=1 Tax=Novosphingobium resinovorum TaxID=158500 RepID=A0A1D8AEL4_9SPHN|nr:putative quinol monooxygenase [Novosphingobium resinovorum]AOR80552.1 hypothetical protein BES08_27290 [Novosphingobium resinovorum]
MPQIPRIVRFTTRRESHAELGERLKALVTETRKEPGCIRYDLFADEAGRWTVIEVWRDMAASDSHLAQPLVVELMPLLEGFLTEPPHIEELEVVA